MITKDRLYSIAFLIVFMLSIGLGQAKADTITLTFSVTVYQSNIAEIPTGTVFSGSASYTPLFYLGDPSQNTLGSSATDVMDLNIVGSTVHLATTLPGSGWRIPCPNNNCYSLQLGIGTILGTVVGPLEAADIGYFNLVLYGALGSPIGQSFDPFPASQITSAIFDVVSNQTVDSQYRMARGWVDYSVVPEPSTMLLLGSGLIGLLGFRKKVEKELTGISIDAPIKRPGTRFLAF